MPPVVTSPRLSVPQLGMEIPSKEITIPTFTIPADYDLILPLTGMMEVTSKVDTNYYKWEATVSAGNNTVESPTYVTKFTMMADSPIKVLAFTTEGNLRYILFIN